jgi:transcriptional regulator with XRE-family HTH domain
MNFRRLRKFARKRYRDIFATSITGTTAAQIRAMREKEGWSQEELAQKAEMGQARISLLENPNYQNLSLNTLKRIANVFDVALIVRFEPFSKLFSIIDNENPQTLAVPSFVEEFGTEESPISARAEKIIDFTRNEILRTLQGTLNLGLYKTQQQGSGATVLKIASPPAPAGAIDDLIDNCSPAMGEQELEILHDRRQANPAAEFVTI